MPPCIACPIPHAPFTFASTLRFALIVAVLELALVVTLAVVPLPLNE